MKLTIIAATGGIGRELLQQAVAAGHDVTAVVRNPAKLSRPVRAITIDLTAPDQAALESAVAGADAVVSGLGPHSNSDAGIAFQGTRHRRGDENHRRAAHRRGQRRAGQHRPLAKPP
jgi:putative NADH-flavin reductase